MDRCPSVLQRLILLLELPDLKLEALDLLVECPVGVVQRRDDLFKALIGELMLAGLELERLVPLCQGLL
jgi:hypothetical protein